MLIVRKIFSVLAFDPPQKFLILLFSADYTDMENLIAWILTFGDKAEVLEPPEAREKIAQMVQNMMSIYKEGVV